MKKEVLRFHYEEIIYVLMILATNLKGYSNGDLKCFAEAIHRLDTLSKPNFLKELILINPNIDDEIVSDIVDLQNKISELYTRQWYKYLAHDSDVLEKSHHLSLKLLEKLNEEYLEPIKFAEKNMYVNW